MSDGVRARGLLTLASAMLLFGLAMAGCFSDSRKIVAAFNERAALVGELPANPLQWKVIAVSIDRQSATTSTLYGNDVAVNYARTHAERDYPVGATLSLVTWRQREDDRYFGARIPDQPRVVEFVFVKAGADGSPSYSYESFEGAPLKKAVSPDQPTAKERVSYLVSQHAIVMP